MPQVATKSTMLTTIFNNMVANTGTSRTDEYFIQTNDITTEDLYDRAFAKKLIITVTPLYSSIIKFQFTSLLT